VNDGNGISTPRGQEPDHESVLRANGFAALRSQLTSAAGALSMPLPAIDAAINFLEQETEVVPDQDIELAVFRVLREARSQLIDIAQRVSAREQLRAGRSAAVPRGRRGS
jgi:hypothetical protein